MNEIPPELFIFLVLFLIACLAITVSRIHIFNIAAGFIGLIFAYSLSKISINGLFVMQYGDITSTDVVITSSESIYNLPQSYIFSFIGIVILMITVMNIVDVIRDYIEPDIGVIEFE